MNSILVIAASAGGLEPLLGIASAIPEGSPVSAFIVVHIGDHASSLPEILSWSCLLKASFARDNSPILPSHIYVARLISTWS
jgi:two-component system chemotaxis response regulator CheB